MRIVSVQETNCGYRPVHVLVEGVDQSKPKWYINAESGAWICFTCGQRLAPHLVRRSVTPPRSRSSRLRSITQRWHEDDEGTVIDK